MNDPLVLVLVLVVALVVAIGAAIWFYAQKRRTGGLRERFGPEYDRAVSEQGDRRGAEAVLQERAERVERLDIRALSPKEREQFSERWRAVQGRFVDDPSAATREADELVAEVMHVRGYPVGDFERRAEDISVDHPHVVEHYRAAHAIALKLKNEDGQASTEDLRQALVHYRALFEDLLEAGEPAKPA